MSQTSKREYTDKREEIFHNESRFIDNAKTLTYVETAILVAIIGISHNIEFLNDNLFSYGSSKTIENTIGNIKNRLVVNSVTDIISLYAFHDSEEYKRIIKRVQEIMPSKLPSNNKLQLKTKLKNKQKPLHDEIETFIEKQKNALSINASTKIDSSAVSENEARSKLTECYTKSKNYILALALSETTDTPQIEVHNAMSYVFMLLGILDGLKAFLDIEYLCYIKDLCFQEYYHYLDWMRGTRDMDLGLNRTVYMIIEEIENAMGGEGIDMKLLEFNEVFDLFTTSSISGGILGLGLVTHLYYQKL